MKLLTELKADNPHLNQQLKNFPILQYNHLIISLL
jgi:hypothetical protein